jgi:hypothetical protein
MNFSEIKPKIILLRIGISAHRLDQYVLLKLSVYSKF